MHENERIEKLSQQLEAAEYERAKLEARLRVLERQTKSVAKAADTIPVQTARALRRFWLRDLLVALLLGITILGVADYLLSNDAIPLLADSGAVISNTPTSRSNSASTDPLTSEPNVAVTTDMPEPPPVTLVPTGSPSPTTPAFSTAPAGNQLAASATALPMPEPDSTTLLATATTVSTPTTPMVTSPPAGLASAPFLQDSFDTPTSGWPVRDEPTWSSEYTEGRYQLTLHGQRTIGVSNPLREANYRLAVDVILGQRGEAGLIVLFQEPATFYQIAFRRDGAYAIQRLDGETVTNVVDWTESAVLRGGAGMTNRIRIERHGMIIRFFANDQSLIEFTLPAEPFTNRFGFTLTSATEQGQASFDNLIGERLSDT